MEWDKVLELELDALGEEKVRAKMARKEYDSSRAEYVRDWLKKKEETRAEALRRQDLVSSKFKDYRNSGIAFSVTLTSLSSALIIWANKILSSLPIPAQGCQRKILIGQILVSAATIVACVFIQFFNYQGYKTEARSLFGQAVVQNANHWFEREDIAVYVSSGTFVMSIIFAVAIFWMAI